MSKSCIQTAESLFTLILHLNKQPLGLRGCLCMDLKISKLNDIIHIYKLTKFYKHSKEHTPFELTQHRYYRAR